MNLLVNSKIKNLEINFNEKESKIDYKEYYFNGIPLEPVKIDNKPKPISILIKQPEVIQTIQPVLKYNKNYIILANDIKPIGKVIFQNKNK